MTTNAITVEVMDAADVVKMPHGNLVMPEDAWRMYVATGARSIRRTADLLHIPQGTVLYWSQRHKWRERLRNTDLEMTEGLAQAAAVASVMQGLASIETLAKIRDNDSVDPRARVDASKVLLAQFNGITAMVGANVLTNRRDEDATEAELDAMVSTPEGVAKLLQMNREGTGRA